MKTPIVEKSTLKGIFIGFAVFCLFSLTVFISRAVDFSSYKIIPPARELKQETWNKLVGSIEGLFDAFKNDISKYEIPVGTVIIYAGDGGCPKGWNQWGDGLDGRLLMPLQTSDGTEVKYGGKKSFTILNENLPKHSHKIIYNGEGSAGISQSSYLAVKNFGSSNIGYADYHLKGTTKAANVGLTSEEGGDSKPIQFMPRYVKVLFCIKGQENPGYDGGNGDDDVVSPQCGTKNGKSGEPTTVEEKCGVGTPSAVTPYNGGYTWKCSNGGLSVDCSSSLSGCPDGQHLNNGLCVADPQCGSKNNQTGEPTTPAEKCAPGTAGSVTSSNGKYNWTCTNLGQTVSCSSSAGTYTIEFSKRWDSDVMGTMSNLECKVGESCKLTKNQYSKNNYDFVGWSVWTTPTETPDYLDEASVLDIASEGKTKTLYPIWKLKEESGTSCTNLPSCNNYHMLDYGQLKGDYCYKTQSVTLGSCVYDCYQTGCQESNKVCYNDINDIPRGVPYTSMIGYCAEKTGKKYWVLEDMNSCNGQASCQFGTSNYISLRGVGEPIYQGSANISCNNENEKCCYYYGSSRYTMKCVKF